MKTVNISPAGAIIANARHRIPELAKVTLDKYANSRFKELKYVTKAFKYQFPFYEPVYKKRSFTKIFSILGKTLERTIPYIETAQVRFLDIPREAADLIYVRIGPFHVNARDIAEDRRKKAIQKYLRKISRLITSLGMPVHLIHDFVTYTRPSNRNAYTVYYADPQEQARNTFSVLEIRIRLISSISETGYLLLMYAPQILKVLETLHRHAHYADTTYRTNPGI